MKVFQLLVLLSFCTNILFAQTKIIAHKSHSGTSQTFTLKGNDNFGMAPERLVINAQLDSVIYVSDNVAIMVTSEYCNETYIDTTSLWKAGRDTAFNHPLFSKQHSLDSIKMVLMNQYYFKNSISDVVFIGYDNNKRIGNPNSQPNQNIIIPILNLPSGGSTGSPILLTLILSFLAFLFILKSSSKRLLQSQ